jgi:hypothetical protein
MSILGFKNQGPRFFFWQHPVHVLFTCFGDYVATNKLVEEEGATTYLINNLQSTSNPAKKLGTFIKAVSRENAVSDTQGPRC